MNRFNHIYEGPPIDWWGGALAADINETIRVIEQMPEASRDGIVYKLYIPSVINLEPIYLCKADNNGTIYIFSDVEIFQAMSEFELIK